MKIGKIQINEVDYAIRANALLGIKETGKTYGAMWFAERLMDSGIPIVAIDPSGVWRYLKVPAPGNEGYPVVVIGDNGDIPLSSDSAAQVMRAAMEAGVSVVFDLFSKHLSKADWRKIVRDICEVLLYENQDYGIRHVFMEEAKEYVPQQVYDKLVFSAVEKLIRIGGNSQVGITLINQRAEGINKDVLELCAALFLFKQVGRNSITNLEKWLKKVDMDNQAEITKSLFTLSKGNCWFFDEDSRSPALIQIPAKKTVHPDRRQMVSPTFKQTPVDVSEFVSRLNKSLAKQAKAVKDSQPSPSPKLPARNSINQNTISVAAVGYDDQIGRMTLEIETLRKQASDARQERDEAISRLEKVRTALAPQHEAMTALFSDLKSNGHSSTVNSTAYDVWLNKLGGGEKRGLELLIERGRLTRGQMRILLGIGDRSMTNYVSTWTRANLIRKEGEYIVLNEIQ